MVRAAEQKDWVQKRASSDALANGFAVNQLTFMTYEVMMYETNDSENFQCMRADSHHVSLE